MHLKTHSHVEKRASYTVGGNVIDAAPVDNTMEFP